MCLCETFVFERARTVCCVLSVAASPWASRSASFFLFPGAKERESGIPHFHPKLTKADMMLGAEEPRSPHLSAEQLKASRQKYPPVPAVCVVTGGTGFVGSRLVEMLVERGAKTVRVLDVVPPGPLCWKDPRIEYTVGSICDAELVAKVVDGADCVWHMAAAVGPFHPKQLYRQVNYEGTVTVVTACRAKGVHKIVMSSSPSTRFDGSDVDGLTEAQMPALPQKRYLQIYAATKAEAEIACMQACDPPRLMTVAVAPHQVYGPRDNLFLPNMLETAGSGRLRIFGAGKNRICFTHNDNYCHGLILAERELYDGSPALGKFYIITDAHTHPYKEGYLYFWEARRCTTIRPSRRLTTPPVEAHAARLLAHHARHGGNRRSTRRSWAWGSTRCGVRPTTRSGYCGRSHACAT